MFNIFTSLHFILKIIRPDYGFKTETLMLATNLHYV